MPPPLPSSTFLNAFNGLKSNLLRQYSTILSTSLLLGPEDIARGQDEYVNNSYSDSDDDDTEKITSAVTSFVTQPKSSLIATLELRMLKRRLAVETIREIVDSLERMVETLEEKVVMRDVDIDADVGDGSVDRVDGTVANAEVEHDKRGKKRGRNDDAAAAADDDAGPGAGGEEVERKKKKKRKATGGTQSVLEGV
mmetsp:Transcript_7653/g.15252  ORF Transcript_7653/g.15252 Transcript_7653/m.15252 type:complete len:196 (-) Transcript_7653:56-643(-)